MFSPRVTSWLPVAGMMVAIAGALGWLLMIYGADHTGLVALPDAAGSRVEFYVDRDGKLTQPEAVRLPPTAWRVWNGVNTLHDEGGDALWLRVTLCNPHDEPADAVLAESDYFVDRFDAWVRESGAPGFPADETGWRHFVAGEAIPVRDRALWGRDVAFPVTVPARGETDVYLRATDHFLALVRVGWWPRRQDFHAVQSRQWIAEGIYFGVLFGLFGYNTMLWLRLRLADIGYYVLYLGAVAVFMFLARARAAELGWTIASPGLEGLIATVMVLANGFLLQFARIFLDLKARLPRGDRVAGGLLGVLVIVAAVTGVWRWWPLADAMQLAVFAVGVVHATLLVMAILTWRAGTRQARFFLLSFGCLFAFSLPLSSLWLAEENDLKHLGLLGLMTGSALEMMLLSFAVADRFAQAQREKVVTQERLIEETEQRRAVEEAYADELAVEVRERTRELMEAGADKDRMITVIGHDLRGPLAGLTQTAELLHAGPAEASVGELRKFTGVVAATGRQVLLIIEDRVLWARLRTGAVRPPVRHQVRAVVEPVIALHRVLAEQRGVRLAVAVPAELRVATDLVLAQTLLRNLVANAVKFARGQVAIEAGSTPEGVRFTVRDDGPGLPAEVRASLVETTREPAAEGLGLRLCVEISHALGARLAAAPGAAGGTDFTFVLADAGDSTPPLTP